MFDQFAEAYEAMIDWPKRLANETPFYQRLFAQVGGGGSKRVLDVACGTGHHAAMFHEWGMTVEAADVSEAMITQARERFGTPVGLEWVVRGFDVPWSEEKRGGFDAVICVGNSLALAGDRAVVRTAIENMLAALRPGGVAVVQVLNVRALPEAGVLWQKSKLVTLKGRQRVVVKGVHRVGGDGYVELLVIDPATGKMQADTAHFLGLSAHELKEMAQQVGAASVRFYGNYQEAAYCETVSTDLILVATR
ncbi:MAG: methyltransferase domain-containing protein [Phycisphaerales bacterium]|nr:methyltransferase domain-containing protein [Phycisphaerales bacterium]